MGMKANKCTRRRLGSKDWCRAGSSALVSLCQLLPDSQILGTISGIQAKVEIIHSGLQTVSPHLSPGRQKRCYLNELGNECVHQRQKDIVSYLCACVVLWNIF